MKRNVQANNNPFFFSTVRNKAKVKTKIITTTTTVIIIDNYLFYNTILSSTQTFSDIFNVK